MVMFVLSLLLVTLGIVSVPVTAGSPSSAWPKSLRASKALVTLLPGYLH